MQQVAIRSAGEFVIGTVKFPKSFKWQVITLDNAARTTLDAVLALAVDVSTPPVVGAALTLDTLQQSVSFLKPLRAAFRGEIWKFAREKIFRRCLRLIFAIYAVFAAVGTIWLLVRLKEQMERETFWRKLQQNNRRINVKIRGRPNERHQHRVRE